MRLNDLTIPKPDFPLAFQSVARVLMDAAERRELVVIRDFQGRARVVEPYRVFQSKAGRRLLNCFQVAGFSRSVEPVGWKNFYLEDIFEACPLGVSFDGRVSGPTDADDVGASDSGERLFPAWLDRASA